MTTPYGQPRRRASEPKPEPGPAAKVLGALILVGLVVGGFWLVGSLFGGSDDGAPAATESATPASSGAAAEGLDPELLFVTSLNVAGVPVPNTDDAVAAGRSVCGALDDGVDFEPFALSFAESSGLGYEQAGQFIGAAVVALCPQHRSTLGI